jgi:hypothetical protein
MALVLRIIRLIKVYQDICNLRLNYNVKNRVILTTGKQQLLALSQLRYQLNSSNNTLMHIISVNMSALPHTVKWETNKNEVITKIIQISNLPQFLGSFKVVSQLGHQRTHWRTVIKRWKKPRCVAVQFAK